MGEPMTLRDEDVGRIGEYVKPWLRQLVDELGGAGTQLLERMVRVEEELQAQRTLMDERFGFMARRFEDMFEHMNKRFEESNEHTNARFKTLTWMIGVGFVVVTSLTTLFALLS